MTGYKKKERCLSDDKEKISFVLKHTFGIKYFAFTTEIKKDFNSMLLIIREKLEKLKKEKKETVAFEIRRNDKQSTLCGMLGVYETDTR